MLEKWKLKSLLWYGCVSAIIHLDFANLNKVLSIFNGPTGGAGVTTSGGTESILMACLSARNKAYVEKGVTEPEM